MKVKIKTILTEEELARCCVLYPSTVKIRDEIISPNRARIETKLGKAFDVDQLAATIVQVLEAAAARRIAS